MKPLIVLIVVFAISRGATLIKFGHADVLSSGRIAMAVMLLFTAFCRFKFTEGMAMILLLFVPPKKLMVWFTGVVEIAAAVGLLTNLINYAGSYSSHFFLY